jgi:hypothetical protein
METGVYHTAVAMAVNLVEIGFMMSYEFHHTGQILILIIAAV